VSSAIRSSGSAPQTVSRSNSSRPIAVTILAYAPGSAAAYRSAKPSSVRSTLTHGPTRGSVPNPSEVDRASWATAAVPSARAYAACAPNRDSWVIR
jgi:hypothetical protein